MAAKRQQFSSTKNNLETGRVEGLGTVAKGVGKSLAKDLGKAGIDDFFAQLLGDIGGGKSEKSPKASLSSTGELKPGVELDLRHTDKKQKAPEYIARPDSAPAINYRDQILRSSENVLRSEKR